MLSKIQTLDKSSKADVEILFPETVDQIKQILNSNKNISCKGSGLSFVPNFFNHDSKIISLKKFNKIINKDLERELITVEAGITVKELLNEISEDNRFLKILPGWPDVTIGGCIANNVHGKNPYIDGIFQEIVEEIEIITPNENKLVKANRNINSELFFNSCGGYGLTGIIVAAKLKLTKLNSKYFMHKKIFTNHPGSSVLELIKNKNSYCSYAWHDFSLNRNWGKGIINLFYESKFQNKKLAQQKIKTKFNLLKYNQPINFFNSFSIKIINNFNLILNSISKNKIIHINNLNFPMNTFPIYLWYFLNGKQGFIESQIIIPYKYFDKFNLQLKNLLFDEEVSVFGNVMKIFNGQKKNLSFDSNGVCVNYEFLNNKKNDNFFKNYYQIVSENHGITSLYKDSKIPLNFIKKQYASKFEDFMQYLEKNNLNNKLNSIFYEKMKS